MSRIREDFRGVVTATGMMRAVTLRAGDVIPDDVAVDGALTDDGQPTRPERPESLPLGPAGLLTDDEVHLALMHGVTLERGPDYVRGYLDATNRLLDMGPGPSALAADLQADDDEQHDDDQHASTRPAQAAADTGPRHAAPQIEQPAQPSEHGHVRVGEHGSAVPPGRDPFDPDQHNAHDVLAWMVSHPHDRDRVLALERAGRARKSIVERYAPSPVPAVVSASSTSQSA